MAVIEFARGALLAYVFVKLLTYLDVKYKTVVMSRRKVNPLVTGVR